MIMVPKVRYDLVSPTCLQGLNCNWGGVVPKALPHLSELAMAEFLEELEAVPVNLPLVPRVVTQVRRGGFLHLSAGLPQVDTQPVSVPAVVIHQLLQCSETRQHVVVCQSESDGIKPECCSPCNKKSSLVQLSYSVMFDGVPVPDTEREVVPPALAVSDQECSVFILW